MAIDPTTAKAIAKVAAKILADKESRSKLLYIVLICLAAVIAILLLPIYILTQPMDVLKSAFQDSPSDATYVEQYKVENDDKVQVIGSDLIYEGIYPLPVKEASISKKYGDQTDPATGNTTFNYGTDFSCFGNTVIYSIADGIVAAVYTDTNLGNANYIIIRHTEVRSGSAETFFSFYEYPGQIYMFEGQSVKQGAVIGVMDGIPVKNSDPGNSTVELLHFEIRQSRDGTGIDPAGYIFPAKADK